MECTKIRDLIITDYLDNEATEAVAAEVAVHLKACAACRGFEQELREKVSDPLRSLIPVTPPESIWQGVSEAIEEEQPAGSPSLLERISEFLAGAFTGRRPVVALSAAFVILLVSAAVLLPFYRQRMARGYLLEQAQFMNSTSFPANGDMERAVNFGTAIEDVFLGELS